MIKITFQTGDGLYWSICESLVYNGPSEWYLLNSVLDNCRGTGPVRQTIVPVAWQIVQVEEV